MHVAPQEILPSYASQVVRGCPGDFADEHLKYFDGFVGRDIQAKDTDRRTDLLNLRDDRSVERLDSRITSHSPIPTILHGRYDLPHHGARSPSA